MDAADKYRFTPDCPARAGCASAPEAMADAVLGMSTGLRDGFVPQQQQQRSVVTTTPTGLRGWVREELVGALM